MKNFTVFLEEKEVQALVKDLATQINHEYKNIQEPLVIICPLKGSLFFVADFIRLLKIPVIVDFVSIETKDHVFHIKKDVSVPLKGRNVLIVKEVLNEGKKLLFLKNRILANEPKSIKVATLIDKPSQRQLDIHPDFFGIFMDDHYIFGYGLDHEEHYRHFKSFHVFTQ